MEFLSAMDIKFPRAPRDLSEAIKIAMCMGPAREFPKVARNLILDHHRTIMERHLREAANEDVRVALTKLFIDLTQEKTNEPS